MLLLGQAICRKKKKEHLLGDKKLRPYKDKINSVIVYKWNRQYPSDMKLDIEPSEGRVLVSSVEFAGYSHEKITKEVYSR